MEDERRTTPMVNATGSADKRDPSANVLLLVGNVKEYLEAQQKLTRDFLEQKLQNAIETSQRERKTETDRVDSCRKDDIEAVRVAYQMQIEQSKVLANQLAENAEALRTGMAKTAETLATQLKQVTESLDGRLKIVEEKQYSLAGTAKGRGDMYGWISAGVILIIAVIGFVLKW